ncbi:MAG: hypothetical protein IJR99_16355 [Kiritimatiellae bacterium]|nr:hypothetical protein [Kiritimatiellia bacterium]
MRLGAKSHWFRKKANTPPSRLKTTLQKAYELIGCKSTDDDAAVRCTYRLAVKRCHLDIRRASGASEGRVAAATEQMARNNDTWDTIRKGARDVMIFSPSVVDL